MSKSYATDRKATVQEVDRVLHVFCLERTTKAKACGASYERLWTIIGTYLSQGGKRLRPYLVLLAYEAYGGKANKSIMAAACTWELLHAGMLVHDDIIDRDDVRHGHRNIMGVYKELYVDLQDASHFAEGAALMAGDLLLTSAQHIILESGLPTKQKLVAAHYLQEAQFYVAGGELMDMETVLYGVDDAPVEQVATYKTASYSFELPLLCGAALAGASESELESLRLIGRDVGVAYQLIDDDLGVFGDVKVTGKPNDSDLHERKRTTLVQETAQHASKKEQAWLETIFASQGLLPDKDIARIRELMEQTGARGAVLKRAQELSSRAFKRIDDLQISNTQRVQLQELFGSLVKRNF